MSATDDSLFDRLCARLPSRKDPLCFALLAAVGLLIYLPFLGDYPLWDPWEPHYTQVAWEMQERDSWLNPWYRGRDNWWSKPILMLWLLRGSLSLFWDPIHHFADNEFFARLPFALFAVAGGLVQYHWTSRLFGRAIGLLAAIILITAPQYLLLGRQVIVDIPFVVTYSGAMGYLAVGLFRAHPAPANGGSARAWWQREWPFVAFWVLQAVSMLAKGLVPPALAVLVLVGYWLATFRWRDYPDFLGDRSWSRYLLTRGAGATLILGLAATGAWLLTLPALRLRASGREIMVYQAIIVGFALVVVFLAILRELPPAHHARRLLVRMRASWGLALFLAIGAPWFIYMTWEHGWPYWNEWLFYHHLGRAAGTIDKPGHTFDYYLLHLGVAFFPWSGFLVPALWRFLSRCQPLTSIAGRRNIFILLAAALPFLFFSLSGTKFAHYIFPVVPFLGVIVAATLVWLGRRPEEPVPLSEAGPPLGPELPPGISARQVWWQKPGSRAILFLFTALSLIGFGIIAHDLVLDFRLILRLFIYYFNRATPNEYFPFVALQMIFFPIGVVIGLLFFARFVSRWHLGALGIGAVVFACYIGWVTMPAMKSTYSFKPFHEAYQKMARPGEGIGQYNDWQQPVRSVIFLFQNRCKHLKNDKQAAAFLKRPGRKFILVDRNRLPALRRVAREVGKKIYVVFDHHPYGRMVSDQPNAQDARQAAAHILSAPPPTMRTLGREGARFGDKITLLGSEVEPSLVKPGDTAKVSFYYRCDKLMDKDWQIFVHGDGPRGGSHRIHVDHYPVDGLYPTTEWQVGEIIRDTFTLPVPGDYPYEYFVLWTGWYIGPTRLQLVSSVPSDGDNRVRGPQIRIKRD